MLPDLFAAFAVNARRGSLRFAFAWLLLGSGHDPGAGPACPVLPPGCRRSRRRAARPSEEYRTPTEEEWAEFLGHFERRKVALGDCGRAYGTSCPHEHSCVRCPVLRIDPDQRPRLADIRDNLTARIAEAEREGWLGEAEGLRVSLAAARDKLAQLDERTRRAATVSLGIPAYRDIAARTATVPGNLR